MIRWLLFYCIVAIRPTVSVFLSATQVRVEPVDVEPPKKPRLEKQENRSSPITVQTSKDLLPNISDYDETNADDFAMEMGLACVVCRSVWVSRACPLNACARAFNPGLTLLSFRQMTVSMGNQLVECQECHNLYHQDCHKPQVTDKDVNDPRLVWYCARCTRQMKRMVRDRSENAGASSTGSPKINRRNDWCVSHPPLGPETPTETVSRLCDVGARHEGPVGEKAGD